MLSHNDVPLYYVVNTADAPTGTCCGTGDALAWEAHSVVSRLAVESLLRVRQLVRLATRQEKAHWQGRLLVGKLRRRCPARRYGGDIQRMRSFIKVGLGKVHHTLAH
jgi:hypothetical protein